MNKLILKKGKLEIPIEIYFMDNYFQEDDQPIKLELGIKITPKDLVKLQRLK